MTLQESQVLGSSFIQFWRKNRTKLKHAPVICGGWLVLYPDAQPSLWDPETHLGQRFPEHHHWGWLSRVAVSLSCLNFSPDPTKQEIQATRAEHTTTPWVPSSLPLLHSQAHCTLFFFLTNCTWSLKNMHGSQNSFEKEQAEILTLEPYKAFPGREMCSNEL